MTQNSCLGYVPSGYNYIINPSFEVNQRGVASVNTTNAFAVDRWNTNFSSAGSIVLSQQTFTVGQTDVPGEPKNYLRAVVTSDSAADEYVLINHKIEDVRTLAGKTATLSFWAKADSTKNIAVELHHAFGSGGSSSINSNNGSNFAITTSWNRYSVILNIPSNAGKTIGVGSSLWINWWLTGGSSFDSRTGSMGNQSGTFEFANVKLEEGSVATPFIVPRYGEELRKCMRYYQKLGGEAPYEICSGFTSGQNTTTARVPIIFKVPMRSVPTVIAPAAYTNFSLSDEVGGGGALSQNPSSVAGTGSTNSFLLLCTVASGLTQYRPYYLIKNNITIGDFIGLSAEL